MELGRIPWTEVREFIDQERKVIGEISRAQDWESLYEEWLEESYENLPLLGFDLGTNALCASLAAARCLPFYSCNGGAFGGYHNDTYPVVVFFCRAPIYPFIAAASEKADVGLEYNHAGGLTAFGKEVDALIDMAAALYDMRTQINRVRLSRRGKPIEVDPQKRLI